MTAINANIDASVGWLPFTEADAVNIAPGYYTVDSENIIVEGLHLEVPSLTQTPANGRWCTRGVGGSTAATHSSGATLTRYYPDAASGVGGGGVTVDNTVDAPFSAATIIAPGATESAPDEATLQTVTLRKATIVVTDAQIKTLPGNPVEIVADIPGEIIVPLLAIVRTAFAVAYTSIDANAQLYLGNGGTPIIIADEGAAVEEAFVSSYLGSTSHRYGIALPRAEYSGVAGNAFGMLGAIAAGSTIGVGDGGLFISASNGGGNPPFGGGDAGNELTVTVWYGTTDRG